ncbi:LysR family transcriptional regulator [Salinisphaera sp. USBA-960]|uniref:hydrogen peroxide-inducible genes activator n=1 Tax=Salinisphaera orenii TaxID=856731 RepID=UPI000DBE88E0|nr:LysR family transcriptional regulator [Salifodinibacter halophilus]NNC25966.1 LysR family transcriptional regulator [Salifodinibacter halophilus]
MNVTLTELRYLIALDKERHFGRASQRAHVSQPTLSVAVKKVERELGVTVFERKRGEACITELGARLIDQAYRVLGEVDQMASLAAQSRDELDGPLRLGVIYTVGPYLLPHLIPRLKQTTPQMPLVIEENFTRTLAQQLRNNELDAVIVATPCDLPGLSTTPLYDESFVVVVPHDHHWTQHEAVHPNELANENLLLMGPGHCFRDQVLELCPECRDFEAEQKPCAGSSLESIRHMVASGLGVTVLPRSSVPDLGNVSPLLAARPLAGTPPMRRVSLAWRSSFPRPGAITALANAAHDCELAGVTTIGAMDDKATDNIAISN